LTTHLYLAERSRTLEVSFSTQGQLYLAIYYEVAPPVSMCIENVPRSTFRTVSYKSRAPVLRRLATGTQSLTTCRRASTQFLVKAVNGENKFFHEKEQSHLFSMSTTTCHLTLISLLCFWRPPLWYSGKSSGLQIRRPGSDSRHYQKKK
jgi:hypothetical protein